MPTKLVIFDCDGVLVDTEAATCKAISVNFARYGLTLDPHKCFQLFVGGTIRDAGEEAARRGVALPSDWLDEMYAEVFTVLQEGVDLLPGILPLLDRLEANGIATCVASNGPQRKMEISLGPSGLHDRFKGRIYSAYTHGPAKPDPAMLNHAIRDFGVAPEECVMIDDNPQGLLAAHAAGTRAIGFDTFGRPERLEIKGAQVVSHHDEIAEILGLD